jgi:hypothetical protein
MAFSLFPLINNVNHPWFGPNSVFELQRESQYFMIPGANAARIYSAVATRCRQTGCADLGVVLGGDTPEYPLWVLLRQTNPRARIEHVEVTNATSACAANPGYAAFKPCKTFTFDGAGRLSLIPE